MEHLQHPKAGDCFRNIDGPDYTLPAKGRYRSHEPERGPSRILQGPDPMEKTGLCGNAYVGLPASVIQMKGRASDINDPSPFRTALEDSLSIDDEGISRLTQLSWTLPKGARLSRRRDQRSPSAPVWGTQQQPVFNVPLRALFR